MFHNRLTHSIKVGQLARRMEKLCVNNPRKLPFSEASILTSRRQPDLRTISATPIWAHCRRDTPTQSGSEKGHLKDGFEGNAQSFRIVAKLAVSDLLSPSRAQRLLMGSI